MQTVCISMLETFHVFKLLDSKRFRIVAKWKDEDLAHSILRDFGSSQRGRLRIWLTLRKISKYPQIFNIIRKKKQAIAMQLSNSL